MRHHRGDDVIELLVDLAATAVAALTSVEDWSRTGSDPDLRTLEHRAHTLRADVARRVADAYVLPIDPEEVLELSERFEDVTAAAHRLLRDAALFDIGPEDGLTDVVRVATAGMRDVVAATRQLAHDAARAQAAAEAVIDHRWDAEEAYARLLSRHAHSAPPGDAGPARRELARAAEGLVRLVAHAARRVVHAAAKTH